MIHWKKGLVEYLSDKQEPRSEKTQVSLHWGPPGVGKSSHLQKILPSNTYWKDASTKWFDGYEFQEHVVFDEFNGGWFPYSTVKRLFDFSPMRVEVKGGSVVFNSKFIHLTTNEDPESWYPNYPYMELHRRIEICYQYTQVGVTPTVVWDHLADPPTCPFKDECPVLKLFKFKNTQTSSSSSEPRILRTRNVGRPSIPFTPVPIESSDSSLPLYTRDPELGLVPTKGRWTEPPLPLEYEPSYDSDE